MTATKVLQKLESTKFSAEKMYYDFSQEKKNISNNLFNVLLDRLKSTSYSDHHTPQMTAKYYNYCLNAWLDNYNGQLDYELFIKAGKEVEYFDLTSEQEALLMLQLDQELQWQQISYQRELQHKKELEHTYKCLSYHEFGY